MDFRERDRLCFPSLGLVLCRSADSVQVRLALTDAADRIGVSTYQTGLPERPCDRKTLKTLETQYLLKWNQDAKGRAGILTVQPDGDGGTGDDLDHPASLLDQIVNVREMLIRGDTRPLYLFWLATCDEEERQEAPVPAGLNQLHDPLDPIAEF